MRISDWSSDVCSSDLAATRAELGEESDYRMRYIEKMATPFQRFFNGFTGSRLGGAWLRHSEFARTLAIAAVLAEMVPNARPQLQFLNAALPPPGQPVKALAYSFCGSLPRLSNPPPCTT